jgi:ribosome-associated toxin RatA of RatAB toxin-antitoxin module
VYDRIQRTGFSLVLLFIGVVLAPGEAATEESIIIEDVTNDQGIHGLRATFHLQASRKAIWTLLTDYDRFKETFKGIRRIEIIDEDEHGARVRYTIKAWILTFDYTLQRDYVRPYELITWRRTDGDFRLISGSWMILPGPREDLHEIVYESYVDVGFLIPTALVRNRAAQELEKTVARMRERLTASPDRRRDGGRISPLGDS